MLLGRLARLVPRVRAQSGVSLLEVLVSLFLLTFALLGLAVTFPTSRLGIARGDQMSTAARLAQQTLEAMRNQTYNTVVDNITGTNFPSAGYGGIPGYAQFRRQVTITNGVPMATCVPPGDTACSKTVRVEVFFRDETGGEQSAQLQIVLVR